MFSQKPLRVISIFFLFLQLKAFSQVVASPSTGCVPLPVLFSGVNGATNEHWVLGSGMGVSTLSNPNVLYTTPGTYNVTYTAIVSGSPVTHNIQVIVKPAPSGSFSYVLPPSHCVPMTVNFTATGNVPNPVFTWAFGDLSPLGNGSNVAHTYVTANSYIPVLAILDPATQCTAVANAASGGTIHVSSLPIINITSGSGYFGCVPPFSTALNASGSISGSPLGGGLNYSWSFNGGTPASSSNANAGNISFGLGTSTINLTVTDNNQCSNSTSSIVTVASPSLSVNVPGTVCINQPFSATVQTTESSVNAYFPNTSSPSSNPTNPNGTTVINPLGSISIPGAATLTFDVPTGIGCPYLSVTKNIFIEEVIANFIPTPSVSTCHSFATITFSNTSTINSASSVSYSWTSNWVYSASHFGTPTLAVLSTPAPMTFSFWQGSANLYTNYNYFMPAIDLLVVSANGCSSHLNVAGDFNMARPTARFISSKKQGCAPITVTFTSTSLWSPDFNLVYYRWCDGSPTPNYSFANVPLPPNPSANNIPPATFTYTNPGTYYPYLVIQTQSGCIDSSYVDTITVVNPPTNLTATFPPTVCAGQSVTINMSATASTVLPSSSGIDHWHVTTDAQFFSGCITNSSPTFSFTHPGVHNVEVYASQAGCASTNTLVQTITVLGPVGKFTHETNCNLNRKMVKFHIFLQDAASAILNFGDGNQTTVMGNVSGTTSAIVTHTYLTTGNYTVTLTSSNGSNSCPAYIMKKTIKVRDAKANITYNGQPLPVYPSPLSCVKGLIKFGAANSIDYDGCLGAFTWHFQSPASSNPSVPGVTLVPTGFSTPILGTTMDVFPGPPQYTVYNYVLPQLKDTFRVAGTYTISLRIKDENNCVDTETKLFRISAAEPDFTITPNPACYSNGTVQLTNFTDGNQVYGDYITKYTWDFGDGSAPGTSTTGLSTITHSINYAQSPTLAILATLIAENQIGCIDTSQVKWQVNWPFANLSFATASYVCIPMNSVGNVGYIANPGYLTYSVNFGYPPSNPVWSTFTNTFTNVSSNYSIPGTYTTTLKVVDAAGCSDTQTLLVNAIGQPTSNMVFEGNKDKFCVPGDPKIKSTSTTFITPISGYQWFFSSNTNTVMSPVTPADTLENILTVPGIYTVKLQVFADGFCPSLSTRTIGVYNPTATAVIQPTMLCLGGTIDAKINIIDGVYKWQWFFGDNVQQPVRILGPFTPTQVTYPYTIYPSASTTGSTVAKLFYESPSQGCSRVIEIPIQIIKLESDFKHYLNKYTHCLGERDTFISLTPNPLNLNLNHSWNFGDQNIGSGLTVQHLYEAPGTYTISMLSKDDQYFCESTSVKTITVFPLPSAQINIGPTLSCPNATFEITGLGVPGVSGTLTASLNPEPGIVNLAPGNTFTSVGSASVNTIYTLTVMDENSCLSEPVFDTMLVQPPTPVVNWDTAVVIGELIPLNAYAGNGFTYTWTPIVTSLNCDTCFIPNPFSNSTVNITYSVLVEDPLQCTIVESRYSIKIIPKVSLDVPTAFTPNGDGINDVIFPDGWGIKRLIYFKVFNRWGQQIFESNDWSVGWDGTYQGVPQNMETYVYQVSVETFLETEPVLNKTGTIKLIR